jgi:hypothetical protein
VHFVHSVEDLLLQLGGELDPRVVFLGAAVVRVSELALHSVGWEPESAWVLGIDPWLGSGHGAALSNTHGFIPAGHTPGLWKHKTRDILFTLIVGDFGVRRANRADAGCLVSTLSKGRKTHVDWKGERCTGLTPKWDCKNRTCGISMPGHIKRVLERFKHPSPK